MCLNQKRDGLKRGASQVSLWVGEATKDVGKRHNFEKLIFLRTLNGRGLNSGRKRSRPTEALDFPRTKALFLFAKKKEFNCALKSFEFLHPPPNGPQKSPGEDENFKWSH